MDTGITKTGECTVKFDIADTDVRKEAIGLAIQALVDADLDGYGYVRLNVTVPGANLVYSATIVAITNDLSDGNPVLWAEVSDTFEV